MLTLLADSPPCADVSLITWPIVALAAVVAAGIVGSIWALGRLS